MWGALKHDLLDFISTIKDDTTKGLHQVLGESSEEEKSQEEKMINDVNRSFTTYSTPIESKYQTKYHRFMKKYFLSSYASEIAELLDKEVDVPRFYADLVPSQLQPEEFWSRYFFRIQLVHQQFSSGGYNDDEDEEEELTWEEETEILSSSTANTINTLGNDNNSNTTTLKSNCTVKNTTDQLNASQQQQQQSLQLQNENAKLKAQIKTLTNRITELEQQLLLTSSSSSSSNIVAAVIKSTTATNIGDDINNDNNTTDYHQITKPVVSAQPALPSAAPHVVVVNSSSNLTAESELVLAAIPTLAAAIVDSENVSESDGTASSNGNNNGSGDVSGHTTSTNSSQRVGGRAVMVSKLDIVDNGDNNVKTTAVTTAEASHTYTSKPTASSSSLPAVSTSVTMQPSKTSTTVVVVASILDEEEEDESWD